MPTITELLTTGDGNPITRTITIIPGWTIQDIADYLVSEKVLENSEYSAREAADILCEALDCECVQVIGRKFVLFKQKKKESAYTAVLAK